MWWVAYGMGVLGAAAAVFLMFERPISSGLRKIKSDPKTNFGPLVIIVTVVGLAFGVLLIYGAPRVASVVLVPIAVLVIGSVRQLFDVER